MQDARGGFVDRRIRSKGMSHAWIVAGLLACWVWPAPLGAGDATPFAARAGLDLAKSAARSWSVDAALVYLENDEPLNGSGAAERWGYLFYSPTLGASRVYSLRPGKIVVAEFLQMRFEAPPLAPDWIDSDAALAAAEREGGREFREQHGGRLSTMLLMRGAFADSDPDRTTWTLVYTAPGVPSLFIVVDASEAKVRRTWRG